MKKAPPAKRTADREPAELLADMTPSASIDSRALAIVTLLTGAVALLVYMRTITPGMNLGDGPEFAASAFVLGVPHPTGYPLYMLVLKAWLLLTSFTRADVILRTTLFNVVVSAITAGVALRILYTFLLRLLPSWSEKARFIAAAAGALSLAFLRFHWNNAIVTEVYALQFLLTLLFIRQLQHLELSRGVDLRRLAFAGLLLGLMLAHHRMSIFLIIPYACAWWWTLRQRRKNESDSGLSPASLHTPSQPLPLPRAALLSAVGIIAGLALYLYIPIRAAAQPPINWGDARTFFNFISHVRGGEYVKYRLLSATPGHPFTLETYSRFVSLETRQILADFAGQLLPLSEHPLNNFMQDEIFARPFVGTNATGIALSLLFTALTVYGAYRLARALPLTLSLVALAAAQNLAFLYLYNITDISDYYLLPFGAAWFAQYVGILAMLDRLVRRNSARIATAGAASTYALLLIPAAIASANYRRCDHSFDNFAERLSQVVLPNSDEILPIGSLVITNADYDLFTSWYRQIARAERRDVLVVGANFLRLKTYAAQFTAEQISKYGLKFGSHVPVGPEQYAEEISRLLLEPNLARSNPVFMTTLFDQPTLHLLANKYEIKFAASSYMTPEDTTISLLRILPRADQLTTSPVTSSAHSANLQGSNLSTIQAGEGATSMRVESTSGTSPVASGARK